jgi:hypothetical protein
MVDDLDAAAPLRERKHVRPAPPAGETRDVVGSHAALQSLAENYVGLPLDLSIPILIVSFGSSRWLRLPFRSAHIICH